MEPRLHSLERRSTLGALVRREAARLPPELLDELYDRLIARPYDQVVSWLRSRFAAAGLEPPDLHPIAFVLVEAMSSHRFVASTFGRTLDDMDDERLIAGWVDVALAVAARHGLSDTG